MSPPKILISYSHDNDEHKKWVKSLATQLRADGIDATIDQWEVNAGESLTLFMEKESSKSDRIIAICTDKYNHKANNRIGGVGYETQLFSAQNMRDIKNNKVIPVIRNVTDEMKTPIFLDGIDYIDISSDKNYKKKYDELVNSIINKGENIKPPLGLQNEAADSKLVSRLSKISIVDDNDHISQIKKAEGLFSNKNYSGLAEMLSEYGRTWIESVSASSKAAPLLSKIVRNHSTNKNNNKDSIVCFLWGTYLQNIYFMFTTTRKNLNKHNPFTENLIDLATEYELRDLFYAERMEYFRKLPLSQEYRKEVLAHAKTLLYILRPYLHNREHIENMSNTLRYSLATSSFILAKYLKSGGLIDESQDYFELSRDLYNKEIPSHQNEISHCEYALDLIDLVQNAGENIKFNYPGNQSFVLGLQLLSQGNYYWIKGNIGNSIEVLKKAGEVFEKLRYNNYKTRANIMIQAINLYNNRSKNYDSNIASINSGFGKKLKFFMGETKITTEIAEWIHSSDIIKVASCAQFYDLASENKKIEMFDIKVKKPLKLVIQDNLFLSYEKNDVLVDSLSDLNSNIEDMNFNKPLPLVFGG